MTDGVSESLWSLLSSNLQFNSSCEFAENTGDLLPLRALLIGELDLEMNVAFAVVLVFSPKHTGRWKVSRTAMRMAALGLLSSPSLLRSDGCVVNASIV